MPKSEILPLLLFFFLLMSQTFFWKSVQLQKETLSTAVRLYLQKTSQAPVLLGHFF